MKGRKRTPTQILKLRGSWRAKSRKDEAAAPEGIPDPPETISADPIALEEWQIAVSQMSVLGTISPLHRWLLAGFCLTVARLVKAQDVLQKHGLTQITEKGEQKRPEVSIVSDCTAQIKAYMAELCITPASQSKAVGKKPESPAGGKSRFFA